MVRKNNSDYFWGFKIAVLFSRISVCWSILAHSQDYIEVLWYRARIICTFANRFTIPVNFLILWTNTNFPDYDHHDSG